MKIVTFCREILRWQSKSDLSLVHARESTRNWNQTFFGMLVHVSSESLQMARIDHGVWVCVYGDLLNEGYRKAQVSARVTVRLKSQSQMCVCPVTRSGWKGSAQVNRKAPQTVRKWSKCSSWSVNLVKCHLFFWRSLFLQIFVRMQSTLPA